MRPNSLMLTRTAMLCGLAALTASTAADVTVGYVNGPTLGYKITHMPDLDQRRMPCDGVLGLASNGSMYCVPTSALNMCVYAANHGFPGMNPGGGNYQSSSKYTHATVNIGLMGGMMGTDPIEGTGGTAYDGLKNWVQMSGLAGQINVNNYYLNNNYTPTAKKAAFMGIAGHLVSPAYGRWDVIGSYDGYPVLDRTGGHMVTLSQAYLVNSEGPIVVRDPADVPTDCVQLSFSGRTHDISKHTLAFCDSHPDCVRTVSVLNHPSDDGRYRIIDSYLTLLPKAGYSWQPGQTYINFYWPFLWNPFTPFNPNHVVNVGGIVDVIMDPDNLGFYVLGEGKPIPCVGHYDAINDEFTEIAQVGTPIGMTMGPSLDIYVLEEGKLICFNPETAQQVSSAEVEAVADLVLWDGGDLIRVLSSEERVFMDYRTGLPAGVPPTISPLPDIPLGANPTVAMNPVDGSCWIASEASTSIYGFGGASPEGSFVTVNIPAMGDPASCITFDDTGRMFVASDTEVFEMVNDPFEGWTEAPDPQFADFQVGAKFKVTCSRTNYDPNEHNGPGWNNIDPDELDQSGDTTDDCLADLNGDNVVNIADVLELLASWGPYESDFEPADIEPLGGDDRVDVADLLRLLAFWGPCP